MTGRPPEADEPVATPQPPPGGQVPTLVESIGGLRGFLDSAVPTVLFLAVNAVAGLRPAVYVAVASGVVLCLVRLLRRETLQQAAAGFAGLALAAFLAARTGKATGFFLPGIIGSTITGSVLLVSALVGRPLVGYVVAGLEGHDTGWRDDPRQRRFYTLLTLGWAALYGGRAGISAVLYVADMEKALAAFKLSGTPMYAGAAVLTFVMVRRLGRQLDAERTASPAADGA